MFPPQLYLHHLFAVSFNEELKVAIVFGAVGVYLVSFNEELKVILNNGRYNFFYVSFNEELKDS